MKNTLENTLNEQKIPVLTLNKVCKRFGGVVAADDISFELYGGEIFGLIGPNGAGKTTLINLITGIYSVDGGTITLSGKNITKASTHNKARLGIVRTFQHPRLLDRCDIKTNIALGIDLAGKRGIAEAKNYKERMNTLLEAAGLSGVNLDDSIEKLSYGQQKMIEIVRAMLSHPKVLLLDEPAAGLNHQEMEYIIKLVNIALKENISVLLIEHAMDLVMSICHRLTVLNFGHQIASGVPAEIQENEAVIKAYLGGSHNA
ncbi:MAG: transporter ATP-binding protein [Clostridiales bacterium]|nr:transporter ATP-binding protein [Clostridiales bacterium]